VSVVVEIIPALLKSMPLPMPGADSDKDGRGQVFVMAGSIEVPGAALLTGEAALRAGAGKLQIAVPSESAVATGLAAPEALVLGLDGAALSEQVASALSTADAAVLGPGWMDEAIAGARVRAAVSAAPSAAFVLDAGAATTLARTLDVLAPVKGRAVLTPHQGEMATMLGRPKAAIADDPAGAAVEAARRFGAVTVLKGSQTHVAAPDGRVWLYKGGSIGLATSGSGDVLAGVVGGLLARGAEPYQAAIWSVFLHGEAGALLGEEIGPLGFLARELLPLLPRLLARLCG
jgi:ADP-dependent NAD(P)H-hydrate dehydratase